jgi:hypothetical protein
MKFRRPLPAGLFLLAGLFAVPLSAQFHIETPARDYSFTISTAQPWTDTGIDLQAGEVVQVHSTSTEKCDPAGVSGADSNGLPVVSAPAGALIARLQSQGVPVLVGSSKQFKVEQPGHLFLGVNVSGTPACSGSFAVKVHISSAAAPATTAAGNSLTAESQTATPSSPAAPATASSADAQNAAPAQDIKSKLASAAQVFLAGQFGNGATSSTTSSSAVVPAGNDAVPPASAAAAAASTPVALKVSSTALDSGLQKDIDSLCPGA